MKSDFEDALGDINAEVFWPEFTFTKNQFEPGPDGEVELADNLIWYDDRAFILQFKAREKPTGDPEAESKWFRRKVLDVAVGQLKDSLKYLDDHEAIAIRNAIGHEFEIRKENIIEFINIIIYTASGALPDDCRSKRHHVSKTAGFIHIIESLDYLSILHVFSTPEDFRQYLEYREKCLTEIGKPDNQITENDIIGSFVRGDELPSPGAQQVLQRIAMEMELLEFQALLANLRNNIQTSEDPRSYYAVLQQFARVPRLVWREVGLRVFAAVDAAERECRLRPTRVVVPSSDLAFMIASLDPTLARNGEEGESVRWDSLTNYTCAAIYLAKTSRCIGILASADQEGKSIDWCFLGKEWEYDEELEKLAFNAPFAPLEEGTSPSYYILK